MKNCFKWFFLVFVVKSNFALSQEKFNPKIWIKSERSTSLDSIEEKQKNSNNTTFNYNPVSNLTDLKFPKKSNNVVGDQISLFLVYKSESDTDDNIISLKKGKLNTFISSKKITTDKEILLNKGDVKRGYILSYFKNNTTRASKRGSLTIDDLLYNDKEGKNKLLELIFASDFITSQERNKIESYLSLKYGISLTNKSYYSSNNQKIWDFKNNKDFSYRITGLGRDDFFNLNQKQSGNVEKDGLYFCFGKFKKNNFENKTSIEDKTFLLWGDNNKSCLFKENDKDSFKTMDRTWKVQTSGKEGSVLPKTEIVVNKKEMRLESDEGKDKTDLHYWIALNPNSDVIDYSTANYYKSTSESGNTIVFDNVEWVNNSPSIFTIVKAPDFFVTANALALDCVSKNDGKINLKITGGIAPFKVKIISPNSKKELTTSNRDVIIDNLSDGNYEVYVSDSQNSYKSLVTIDPFKNYQVSLEKEYFIVDNNEIEIAPKVIDDKEELTYIWYFNEDVVSNEKSIKAIKTGNYKLILSNKKGCEKEIPFEVKSNDISNNNQWSIYPNPVESGQNFKVDFHLTQISSVSIKINDISGKQIKVVELKDIQNYTFNDVIQTSGTYLLTITINGTKHIYKLIVK